jgi:hypothetical protein
VPESQGSALQAALQRQLVLLLGRVRGELDRAGGLALGPAPDAAGTVLEGRLLDRLGPVAAADPLAALALRGLRRLVSTGGAQGAAALHGWDGGADGRGYAYSFRHGGLTAATAVTGDGDATRVRLVVAGSGGASGAALDEGWSLTISARVSGTLELVLGPEGPPQVTGATASDTLSAAFSRGDTGKRIGAEGGPGIRLGRVAFGGELNLRPDLDASGRLSVAGGGIELAVAALSGLLPRLDPIPLDVELRLASRTGASVAGSPKLRTRLPAAGSLPGLSLGGIDLQFEPTVTRERLSVDIQVRTSVATALRGLPIALRLDGLGLQLPFSLDTGAAGALEAARVNALEPAGGNLDVALPVIRAGGGLVQRDGAYLGRLSAAVPPMTATAFAALHPAAQDRPFSVLVVVGATFPPPGVQVGFGFAVDGVGGIVGVNHRVDREGLMRAVADGSASALLFPSDPAASGEAAMRALTAIFPAEAGSVVAGPMFRLTWGGRILRASAATVMEFTDPPRLTILGDLTIAIPDPLTPIVFMRATFAGLIDPAEPSVVFLAALTGSHIAGLPMTGDVCVLVRGGADPTFVLTAGGFHPAFPVPRGVPPLRRIAIDLSPSPLIQLRCEAYLAITANSVQFGARIDLGAEIAGCGLRGHLSIDLLFEWRPHLHFLADVGVGIAVTFLGETLVGVNLALHLEGPNPWRARGRGSIDLFLFSPSFDFDERWGSEPPLPPPVPDVERELRRALSASGAWVAHRPPATGSPLRLTASADQQLGRGTIVDPYGSLSVRQRRVPLGIEITRFDQVPLPAPQRWDITGGKLGERPAPASEELREPFAPGQFLMLTDDEQLGRRAFEPFRAGVGLAGGGSEPAPERSQELEWETIVLVGEERRPLENLRPSTWQAGIEGFAGITDALDPAWLAAAEVPPPVDVADAPPVTVASTWALQVDPAVAAAPTETEMLEAVVADERPAFTVVESWEVLTA